MEEMNGRPLRDAEKCDILSVAPAGEGRSRKVDPKEGLICGLRFGWAWPPFPWSLR